MTDAYRDFAAIRAALQTLPKPDASAIAAARDRDAALTKPAGALARLEDCVFHLAGWQRRTLPQLDRVHIVIFAGNHGVVTRGVSAYPADVTVQMVANFERGGAAINQLARMYGADLSVIALDLDRPTADFTVTPAMEMSDCLAAINRGVNAIAADTDLLILGEMGIGNTTAAAALTAALYGGDALSWVGPGTGVAGAALAAKISAVDAALRVHGESLQDPLEALRRVGGRELAALFWCVAVGASAGHSGVAGRLVVGAAAGVLNRLDEDGLANCLAGHVSAEPGHRRLLDRLRMTPLLDLGMRLEKAQARRSRSVY